MFDGTVTSLIPVPLADHVTMQPGRDGNVLFDESFGHRRLLSHQPVLDPD